ncbi:PASTA domain-containing protein [Bifidobacterium ramosum]|nr:PASTA domain-containing protein [Bifidobacterium ramosum]KAB8288367.1 PASTA domain-containing protein [Bifidobacterium ramosum]
MGTGHDGRFRGDGHTSDGRAPSIDRLPDKPTRSVERSSDGIVARSWTRVTIAVIVIVAMLGLTGVVATRMWRNMHAAETTPSGSTATIDSYTLPEPTTDAAHPVMLSTVTDNIQRLKLGVGYTTQYRFSGLTQGALIGYGGTANAGYRITKDSIPDDLTFIVSRGSGIPDDIIGNDATDVPTVLQGMGVAIQYASMPVDDTDAHPAGTVVATNPAPGTAVTSGDTVTVGVAVANNANVLGADIIGQRSDDARQSLESQGYTVDLQPRFSSSGNLGTIVASNPRPGATLSDGQTVTLYYGVDMTGAKDVFSETRDDLDGLRAVRTGATSGVITAALAGTYCKDVITDTGTAQDATYGTPTTAQGQADGQCLTLTDRQASDGSGEHYLVLNGDDPAQPADRLGLTNFAHDIGGTLLEADPANPTGQFPMRNHLLAQGLDKNWGIAELYAGLGLPNCGDTVFEGTTGQTCERGLTYRMKDFLVYFAAGANVDALEDSGYFDQNAFSEALSQSPVDGSRPFVLVRDSSAYDTTSKTVDDGTTSVDPFVPTGDARNQYRNAMVGMKPAVSGETAYYLVEQPYDWKMFDEYTMP